MGLRVIGRYTADERQQWLNVAASIDDQGNTCMYLNGMIQDAVIQPSGVAGNLNLESDMFLGNSPLNGVSEDNYGIR